MQDWLYDEGDDATKATYVAKMDEIRFVAGPIIARYLDKVEEERQAAVKAEEEKAAKRKAELEARRKADDEAKKAAEAKSEKANGTVANGSGEDAEMKDADSVKPDKVEDGVD